MNGFYERVTSFASRGIFLRVVKGRSVCIVQLNDCIGSCRVSQVSINNSNNELTDVIIIHILRRNHDSSNPVMFKTTGQTSTSQLKSHHGALVLNIQNHLVSSKYSKAIYSEYFLQLIYFNSNLSYQVATTATFPLFPWRELPASLPKHCPCPSQKKKMFMLLYLCPLCQQAHLFLLLLACTDDKAAVTFLLCPHNLWATLLLDPALQSRHGSTFCIWQAMGHCQCHALPYKATCY